jgi:4-aminobutyrate aminotransferase
MTQMDVKEKSSTHLSKVLSRYHDIVFEKGEGAKLTDIEGKTYIDLSSGLAVCSTGHCHPEVVEAICHQARSLIHPCIGNGHYEVAADLAEKINRRLSQKTQYSIFFGQSGSEANEAAIKLARYVSKRPHIIAFKGGFHGRTLGALSLTTSKMKYREGYEPLLQNISFFDYPYAYRCPWGKTSEKESIAASIKALTTSPLFNDSVAAVFIEPALGEGGYVPAPKEFLEALRKICDRHGIFLIFDEVQTGFGRTGKWFSFQHTDIEPDIITLAKGIASGMPLGACCAKKDIMDRWTPGAHGGTFGANPVSCAAGNATITVLDKALETVPKTSDEVFQLLRSQLKNHPHIGDIRGMGFFIGIEWVKDKTTKTPYPEIIPTLLEAARKRGIIIISCGIHNNVIRIIPPLTIEKSELIAAITLICEIFNAHH